MMLVCGDWDDGNRLTWPWLSAEAMDLYSG